MSKNSLIKAAISRDIEFFLQEDDLSRNFYYLKNLPYELVECCLIFKSEMVVAGLPYLVQTFEALGFQLEGKEQFVALEGKKTEVGSKVTFELPFAVALTGERIALNLLQHASSIATLTNQFVSKARGIAILDTRKTTPGLRALEKYAVRVGGGANHRFGQSDVWMVKDNHKSFFGGVKPAVDFFRAIQGFYTPIVVEVHQIEELRQALDIGIKHVMLDNFSPELVSQALAIKPPGVTYEISGGINLSNIDNYLLPGIDAISIGALTANAPRVDISLKYQRQER